MSTHRSRLGLKDYLGAFGQILGEIFFPLVMCIAGAGLLLALEVHPYVSMGLLTGLAGGGVFSSATGRAKPGIHGPLSI